MSERVDQILQEAMKLSNDEREIIADVLMQSVIGDLPHESDPEWQAMISRRIEEVESGKVKPISWEEVRRQAFGDLEDSAGK